MESTQIGRCQRRRKVFNLSFPSKPNKMYIISVNCESQNPCLLVECLCFYWWVMNWCWWLWIESVILCCGLWCFFFLALWPSLLYYIDKRDRERERVEFVEITQIREYLFDCLFVLCWLVVGHNWDKWQKIKVKLKKSFC